MTTDTTLLTVFLKHDQSQNLDTIQGKLKAAEWWDRFPPEGVEVVSWTVAMGFGQIVTLRVPPPPAAHRQCRTRAFGLGRIHHRMFSHL